MSDLPEFAVGSLAFCPPHHALVTVLTRADGKVTVARFPGGAEFPGQVEEEELMVMPIFLEWARDQDWYGKPEQVPVGDWNTYLLFFGAELVGRLTEGAEEEKEGEEPDHRCPLCQSDPDEHQYIATKPPFAVAGCRRCGLNVKVRRLDDSPASLLPAMGEAQRRWLALPRSTEPYALPDSVSSTK